MLVLLNNKMDLLLPFMTVYTLIFFLEALFNIQDWTDEV